MVLLWFNLADCYAAACSLSPGEMGERIRKVSLREIIVEVKTVHQVKQKLYMHKENKARNLFSVSHQQAGVEPLPGKLGSSHITPL